MPQNKMTAPVLAHRDGQRNEPTQKLTIILPLLRAAVKMAATALAVYLLAAAAALNILAVLAAILAENWLLGLYFRLQQRKEALHDPAGDPNCI